MANPNPLRYYARQQVITERELRAALRSAAREIDRMLRTASNVRAEQLRIQKAQLRLWLDLRDIIRTGMTESAVAAANVQALFDSDLLDAAGIDAGVWRASLEAQARATMTTFISRRHNGLSLSERVYKNYQLSNGIVDRVIDDGILSGKSAREIAKDVARFIRPDVPGGVSYAAMRLGRTELNNAFHTTQIEQFKNAPYVTGSRWNLSGSHPKPDQCDDYAMQIHNRGGEPGVFKPADVPAKPHPQCLCYITPMTMSDDAFARAFRRGRFDSYIDEVLAPARIA